jgi:lipoprotein-anchoring transpeptidase ErfK/SrfK
MAVFGEFPGMIWRSALALGALATGFATLAQAQYYPPQPYPPANSQVYPPYRPVPGAAIPDDDDDDLPPHLRAAPGNYPPPPGGYTGPFANDPRRAPPGVQRDAAPGPGAPGYGRGPAVVYGDRAPEPYPQQQYGRQYPGGGQPESYGAAPQPGYPPREAAVPQPYSSPYGAPPAYQEQPAQGPMQLAPGQRPSRDVTGAVPPNTVASLPPEDQPETGKAELPPQFKRQMVTFQSNEPAGTIVIDTANTYLYLVLGNGQAMRYGIGVGREGFTWAGAERVSRMAEWPDWHPPSEMIERQPYLPRFMAGGEGNPLGARALYLGKTLYRIHGTNQPSTIGKYVSSGCIRLTNEDIADLYSRVQVGTRIVVLPGAPPAQASNLPPPQQQPVQQR